MSPDSVAYRAVLPHEGEGETELFPGITPVVLAGAALVPPATATAVAYGLSLAVAGDMALGTNGTLFPPPASTSRPCGRCGRRRASPSSCS